MQKTRLLSTIALLTIGGMLEVKAQYNSINIDYQTASAMTAEYGAAAAAESYYDDQVKDILDKYGIAEVAAAGIFASKHLDRKALTDLGLWTSASENHYYRRIYNLVSAKIIPQLWELSSLLLRYPHKALYWGSYLVKTCTEVKSLCHQFESIVTNGTLSFSDIPFLEVRPELASLVQLSQLGNVDWRSVLHSLTYIPTHYTRENLTDDLGQFYLQGTQLAASGYSQLTERLMGSSSFNGTLLSKASGAVEVAGNVYDLYQESDGNLVNLLNAYWGASPTSASIFDFAQYNATSWISDYLSPTEAACYTQRYYIASVENGSELVCQYDPPKDNNSITKGSDWVRFDTSDPSFTPTSSQLESVLRNSESCAGWSRSMVTTLNTQGNESTYEFSSGLHTYTISSKGKQTRKAYAYNIIVTRSWHQEETVYEEVFDSFTMDLPSFLSKMNGYVDEYNDNETGRRYQLLSDARQYYEPATDAKIKGCESAVITLTCSDKNTLGEGSTQYKCGDCGSTLNAHSKTCAMRSTLSASDTGGLDLSSIQGEVSELQRQLSEAESQKEQLQRDRQFLASTLASYPTPGDQRYNETLQELEQLDALIAELSRTITELKTKISQDEQVLQEATTDDVATDDYYRIPAIMNDLRTVYRLNWQGEGWWSGYTYYRYADCPSINGTLTFQATLSIVRTPSYLFGIKIHRTIVKISWSLSATYTETQVIDNLTFTADEGDEDRARRVNEVLSQLARDYPSCTPAVEYIRAEDEEVEDESDDTQHLLWASDRLAIARQVEARLMAIYANIVSMRKMMHYRLGILDVMRGVLPPIDLEEGRNHNLAERSRRRWLRNAARQHHSEEYNGKYESDEEDTP